MRSHDRRHNHPVHATSSRAIVLPDTDMSRKNGAFPVADRYRAATPLMPAPLGMGDLAHAFNRDGDLNDLAEIVEQTAMGIGQAIREKQRKLNAEAKTNDDTQRKRADLAEAEAAKLKQQLGDTGALLGLIREAINRCRADEKSSFDTVHDIANILDA